VEQRYAEPGGWSSGVEQRLVKQGWAVYELSSIGWSRNSWSNYECSMDVWSRRGGGQGWEEQVWMRR
jgi:hypothetical protein